MVLGVAGSPDGVVQVGRQVLQQLDGTERGDRAAQAVPCGGGRVGQGVWDRGGRTRLGARTGWVPANKRRLPAAGKGWQRLLVL